MKNHWDKDNDFFLGKISDLKMSGELLSDLDILVRFQGMSKEGAKKLLEERRKQNLEEFRKCLKLI